MITFLILLRKIMFLNYFLKKILIAVNMLKLFWQINGKTCSLFKPLLRGCSYMMSRNFKDFLASRLAFCPKNLRKQQYGCQERCPTWWHGFAPPPEKKKGALVVVVVGGGEAKMIGPLGEEGHATSSPLISQLKNAGPKISCKKSF